MGLNRIAKIYYGYKNVFLCTKEKIIPLKTYSVI
jgi:hypothetical protein